MGMCGGTHKPEEGPLTLPPSHSVSHSLCLTLSLSHTPSVIFDHSHTLPLAPSLSHTPSLSLSLPHTDPLTLSPLTHSLTPSPTASGVDGGVRRHAHARGRPSYAPSLSLCLSLPLSYSLFHTLPLSYFLSHTHTPSLLLSHTHFLCLTLSLSLPLSCSLSHPFSLIRC